MISSNARCENLDHHTDTFAAIARQNCDMSFRTCINERRSGATPFAPVKVTIRPREEEDLAREASSSARSALSAARMRRRILLRRTALIFLEGTLKIVCTTPSPPRTSTYIHRKYRPSSLFPMRAACLNRFLPLRIAVCFTPDLLPPAHDYRSSLTVSFFRPFARRRANTFRPFLVAMRWRKPCVFFRFRRCG